MTEKLNWRSGRLRRFPAVATLVAGLAAASPSFASTTTTGTMPWDTVLTTVETALTGPVAVAVGVVAVVITGLGIALGGEGSFMRRAFGILFGLSVAFMSSTAILTFFGSSGAVF